MVICDLCHPNTSIERIYLLQQELINQREASELQEAKKNVIFILKTGNSVQVSKQANFNKRFLTVFIDNIIYSPIASLLNMEALLSTHQFNKIISPELLFLLLKDKSLLFRIYNSFKVKMEISN